MKTSEETEGRIVYTDAVISQVGVGCLEFKAIRREDKEGQEINIYSQMHGKSNDGWGTKIFSGTLPELIEYHRRANTALAILTQIGSLIQAKRDEPK